MRCARQLEPALNDGKEKKKKRKVVVWPSFRYMKRLIKSGEISSEAPPWKTRWLRTANTFHDRVRNCAEETTGWATKFNRQPGERRALMSLFVFAVATKFQLSPAAVERSNHGAAPFQSDPVYQRFFSSRCGLESRSSQ
mmetsp:Transcript_17704/g.38396  ORF Transcript_17704/g.38396 Transcript_17704/m.38396 type:complete len:139 (-) Transcript_17704:1602-2018(-)